MNAALDDPWVSSIAEAGGDVWVGSSYSVFRVQGERVVKPFKREDQIALEGVGEIPPGYVIRSQARRFRQWLDSHHIDYQVVQQPETVQLEQQRVADLNISARTKPGTRDWLDVTLDEKPVKAELEPGDIKISTAQPQGPLIAIMLDPRSSNSLYQEPSWRALLLSNPLPTAPLIEPGQQIAKDQDKKAKGHGQG